MTNNKSMPPAPAHWMAMTLLTVLISLLLVETVQVKGASIVPFGLIEFDTENCSGPGTKLPSSTSCQTFPGDAEVDVVVDVTLIDGQAISTKVNCDNLASLSLIYSDVDLCTTSTASIFFDDTSDICYVVNEGGKSYMPYCDITSAPSTTPSTSPTTTTKTPTSVSKSPTSSSSGAGVTGTVILAVLIAGSLLTFA